MAVKYELPFKRDREGAGFQDAVIYSSVLDHLTMDAERIGALLTTTTCLSKILSKHSPRRPGGRFRQELFHSTVKAEKAIKTEL